MSRKIEDLEPETRKRCKLLMDWCYSQGYNVFLTSTKRTHEEQQALYDQGRYKPGKIVTNAKAGQSWHETGRAFDFAFHDGKGGATWVGPWEKIATYAATLGLQWGGNFKRLGDRDHFQYTAGLTLADAIKLEDQRNLA